MENALVRIGALQPQEVFVDGGIKRVLSEIEAMAIEELKPATVTTASGRKIYASVAYKVAQSKTAIDGLGKELVSDWKEKSKKVDAVRKEARDYLDELKERVRKPLTDFEQAEKERAAREKAEAEFAQAWDEAHAEHDLYLRQKAIEAKEAEMARIEAEKRAKEEAERIEKERIERESRIAKEAEERAKREAQEAIERAERERVAAIERAKVEAKQAEQRRVEAERRAKEEQERAVREAQEEERRRVEQEKREKEAREAAEKAEAERKAANKRHRAKINKEAKAALVREAGLSEEQAEAVIIAIAKEKIACVSINY